MKIIMIIALMLWASSCTLQIQQKEANKRAEWNERRDDCMMVSSIYASGGACDSAQKYGKMARAYIDSIRWSYYPLK